MTDLVRPDRAHLDSWADAVRDFDGGPMDGSGHWLVEGGTPAALGDPGPFVDRLVEQDADDPPRPPGLPADAEVVRSTFWWVTDGEPGSGEGDVVGFLNLRHGLPGFLLEWGGHIGYSVRPSRRRQGHASRALGLGLERAGALGIDPVLLTCDPGNEGSRRTIESHGGVLEDQRQGKLRFWVPAR